MATVRWVQAQLFVGPVMRFWTHTNTLTFTLSLSLSLSPSLTLHLSVLWELCFFPFLSFLHGLRSHLPGIWGSSGKTPISPNHMSGIPPRKKHSPSLFSITLSDSLIQAESQWFSERKNPFNEFTNGHVLSWASQVTAGPLRLIIDSCWRTVPGSISNNIKSPLLILQHSCGGR